MKKLLFLLITMATLNSMAQKTTPIYGDTVSVIKNFKVGYYSYLMHPSYRHANQYLSIDSATGKIIIVPIPESATISAGNGLFTRNDSVLLGTNLITENVTLDAITNQKDFTISAKKFVFNAVKSSGTGSNSSIYGEVNNPGGNAIEISSTNTNIGGAHSTGTYISGNTTSSGIYSFGIKLDPGLGGIGITTSAGGASDTTLITKDETGHIHHLDKTDFKNKFGLASSSINTFYSADDSIRTTRYVSGADTNALWFRNFNSIYGLGRSVFMGTLKYHFFAYPTATGQECYDTISGTPVRTIIAIDQASHLVQLGTFYDGVTKYSLQQSTKDKLWSKVTNGVDSTSITLYPEKIQFTGIKDTIPAKLYSKDANGNFVEFDYLKRTINVPATTDSVFVNLGETTIIAPASTIGSVYVVLPANPTDKTRVEVKFSETVNTTHWVTTDGSTVKGTNTPDLVPKGILITLYYDLATTTWY